MISDRSIRRVDRSGEDYDRAARLKQTLACIRRTRTPFHLRAVELEPILQWKLGAQYGRTARLRDANSDATIRQVTRIAFSIALEDRGLELRLRTAVLCTLGGIGVPVASAILALTHPER